MRLIYSIFLLISFIAMAGFGFLAMSPQGDMHGCIAALTRGVQCPAESDSFSSLAFHAGVIKSFSTATVSGLFAIFLLLAAFVLAFMHRSGENVIAPFLALLFRCKPAKRIFVSSISQRIWHWIALHENSPAFA